MRKLLLIVAVAATGVALAEGGDGELVEQRGNRGWHFRVGPVFAPRVRVKVRCPRPDALPSLTLPGLTVTSGMDGNVAADPSAGYADRIYTDGYVKPDEGTADPDTMVSGLTWNWGAKNVGSQYSSGRMDFHTERARWSESASASSTAREGSGFESDRDMLLGVEAMGGFTFFENERFDVALDAGFRYYGSGDMKERSRYGTTVTVTRNEYRYVDSYDASGWKDVPSGAYNGSAGGPGRLLGATPTRQEELMNSTSSSQTYYNRVSTKVDYQIWDLRLGPTAGWKVRDWLMIRGGAYGLLGLVDARLRTDVQTANGSYSSKKSTCEGIFGMAASLSAQVNFTESLFLMGGVEYDWWSDAVHLRAGGADAHIKLSDIAVSLALGMDF